MHWLLAVLAYHIAWFGPLVKGNPVLLIADGQMKQQGMRRSSASRRDIEQAMRTQGEEPALAQIHRAYLERDGSISIISRDSGPKILDVSVADGVQTVRIALE